MVFAEQYGFQVFETSWNQISIGCILRGEFSNRLYLKLVKKGKILPIQFAPVVRVPKCDWSRISPYLSKTYEFSEVPHHKHYFDLIQQYRVYIRQLFFQKVHPRILDKSEQLTSPVLSIHIRLGDFKNLPWTHYNWNWYVKLIDDLRKVLGVCIEISLFSDGKEKEIPLFDMVEGIKYYHSGNDMLDLIKLSESKILIPYPGSTFGYWAGFMGDAILIHRNETIIRGDDVEIFEGYPFNNDGILKEKLVGQLKRLRLREC